MGIMMMIRFASILEVCPWFLFPISPSRESQWLHREQRKAPKTNDCAWLGSQFSWEASHAAAWRPPGVWGYDPHKCCGMPSDFSYLPTVCWLGKPWFGRFMLEIVAGGTQPAMVSKNVQKKIVGMDDNLEPEKVRASGHISMAKL